MAYPTRYDLIHRPQVVRRRDSFECLEGMSELRRKVAETGYRHMGTRLELVADFFTARHNCHAYDRQARNYGLRLPG